MGCSVRFCQNSPSLSLLLLDSDVCGDTGGTGHRSLDLESLFRKVGGPVGVRAGFCIGGGLVDVDWGDAGRCFIVEGDGGRALEFCLKKEMKISGSLFGINERSTGES